MAETYDRRRANNRPTYRAEMLALAPPPLSMFDEAIGKFTPAWIAEIVESGELPDLIRTARDTEASARLYRQWLESLTDDDAEPRACPVCGGPVRGRADRRYCSDTCRQKGYRSSRVKA